MHVLFCSGPGWQQTSPLTSSQCSCDFARSGGCGGLGGFLINMHHGCRSGWHDFRADMLARADMPAARAVDDLAEVHVAAADDLVEELLGSAGGVGGRAEFTVECGSDDGLEPRKAVANPERSMGAALVWENTKRSGLP